MPRRQAVLIWNSLHACRLPIRHLILLSRWTCSGLPKWQNPSGTLPPTRHHENTSYPHRRQRPKGRLRRYVCSMMTRRGSRSHRKSKSFGVCVFLQKIPLFGTPHRGWTEKVKSGLQDAKNLLHEPVISPFSGEKLLHYDVKVTPLRSESYSIAM